MTRRNEIYLSMPMIAIFIGGILCLIFAIKTLNAGIPRKDIFINKRIVVIDPLTVSFTLIDPNVCSDKFLYQLEVKVTSAETIEYEIGSYIEDKLEVSHFKDKVSPGDPSRPKIASNGNKIWVKLLKDGQTEKLRTFNMRRQR